MINYSKLKKIFVMFFLCTAFSTTFAQSPNKISTLHIKKLLGPYPAHGSVEEAQDFDILLNYQATRSEEECQAASNEVKGTFESFFGGEHGPLTPEEVKHFSLRLKVGMVAAAINMTIAKQIFKRPRPYLTHPEIKPCIKISKTYAYPSGHSTLARVYARILSKIYPERSTLFMKRADEIAMHRVLGGVHHPSDIVAAKKLGDAIAIDLLHKNSF